MKMKIFTVFFSLGLSLPALAGSPSSTPPVNENSLVSSSKVAENNSSKDQLWGYSSEGRELFDIATNTGTIIQAVDVDGLARLGDMILGRTEDLKLYGLKIVAGEEAENSMHDKKANIRYPNSGYKWPGGVVPFVYSNTLGYNARRAMNYAIDHWNRNTNVRFVQRTNQRNYLVIEGGNSCSSWVGRQGGAQSVTLAEGCGYGAAVHELGHALGFFHEQNRSDRDNYITIYWDNIVPSMQYNFNTTSYYAGAKHGSYDYYSIMHYGIKAFSKNNKVTMWPKANVNTNYLGNGTKLSQGDIYATAAIYGWPNYYYGADTPKLQSKLDESQLNSNNLE
ncbi:M12 family metallopeptidase [Aliikangiella sp. IMCC44359]|uniref:M12 family metallopeptidase n=1 Tax=Aliikangiella sp. IMCC44359 TaxID=3459125 RepID=UPI00403B05FF